MPTLPRFVSTSKARERPSSSRIECCNSVHTLNIPMSQRRRTIEGIRTRIGSTTDGVSENDHCSPQRA
jgi:hypothetical protein